MATLTDAKFDALRAQGFTGSISDMMLQWLQANSGATEPADEYVNPELAGGAPSGDPATDNNPPTAHGLGFRTVRAVPVDNGDGTFNWEFNQANDSGRNFLQYSIEGNHAGLSVGDKIAVRYSVFQHPGGSFGQSYAAAFSVTNQSGCDIQYSSRTSVEGLWRTVGVDITITDPVYTGQMRVGTGTTSAVDLFLEVRANPTAVVTRAAEGIFPRTIPDGWRGLLELYQKNTQRNTGWYDLLGDEGYTGSLNDRELAFWLAGGVLSPPPNPPVLLGAFSTAYSEDFD